MVFWYAWYRTTIVAEVVRPMSIQAIRRDLLLFGITSSPWRRVWMWRIIFFPNTGKL